MPGAMKVLGATIAVVLLAFGAHAADMRKTLHVAFPVAENGFDPQAVYDSYYFARPVRLVPNTAEGMPQITDGGRTFTVKVRPGIYFADDPAFKGRKR